MQRDLRPMGVLEIIDASFRIYREHFLKFLAINAIVFVPYTLFLAAVMPGLLMEASQAAFISAGDPTATLRAMLPALSTTLLGMLFFQQIATGAITAAVADSYLGKAPSVSRSYATVVARFGTLFGAILLSAVITAVGFVIIVPGIVFMLWFSIVSTVVIIEKVGIGQSLARSRALVTGFLSKVFGLLILVGIMTLIFSQIGQIIGGMFVPQPGLDLAASGGVKFTAALEKYLLVQTLAGHVVEMFVGPLMSIAHVLLYYDLRIRKEGFDMEVMSNEILGGAERVTRNEAIELPPPPGGFQA
jgi:hypothetical protein